MNRVLFPLNGDSRGAALDDLHRALLLFLDRRLIQLSEADRADLRHALILEGSRNEYRAATSFLVAAIQDQKAIATSEHGKVDEVTSDAINSLLWEADAAQAQEAQRVVVEDRPSLVGKVNFGNRGFRRGTVVLVKRFKINGGAEFAMRLGTGSVDEDGSFTIQYEPLRNPGDGVFAVEFVAMDGKVLGSTILPRLSEQPVVITIEDSRRLNVHSEFVLSGRIVENNSPLVGYAVTIMTISYSDNGAKQLGSAVSAVDGSFQINYFPPMRVKSDGTTDTGLVQLNVLDPDGRRIDQFEVYQSNDPVGEQQLTTEELTHGFRSRNGDNVRLVLSRQKPDPHTEFRIMQSCLQPLLSSQHSALLIGGGDTAAGLLSRETNLERDKIEDYMLSQRLCSGIFSGVAPEIMYGVVRNLNKRSALEIATADEELERAIESSIAASELATPAAISEAASFIRQRASIAAFGDNVTTAAINLLLEPFIPREEDRKLAMARLANASGDLSVVFDAAEPESSKKLSECRLAFRIAAVSDSRIPFLSSLASVPGKDWRERTLSLDEAALRGFFGTTSDREKDEQIVGAVQSLLDRTHPTSAMARVAGKLSKQSPAAVEPPVASLLEKLVLYTNYEVGSGGVSREQLDSVAANGGAVAPEHVAGVLRLERIHAVSGGIEQFELLARTPRPDGAYFSGAFDIAALSRQSFLRCFGTTTQKLSQQLALTHRRAQARTDAVAQTLLSFHRQYNDPPITAVGRKSAPESWRKLFGEQQHVQCEEWQSVGGPASYFVQILEYLRNRATPNAYGVTPLDFLIGNEAKAITGLRPDLGELKLSREATEQQVLEIDLNIEIMERNLASTMSTTSLDAPGQIYRHLEQQVFPISFPFDRVSTELRQLFAAARIDFQGMVDLLFSFGMLDPHDATCHRLGLTRKDLMILEGELEVSVLFGWKSSTGVTAEAFLDDLRNASVQRIAASLGLSVTQLLAICKCSEVGGGLMEQDTRLLQTPPLPAGRFHTIATDPSAVLSEEEKKVLRWFNITVEEIQSAFLRNADLIDSVIVADPPGLSDLSMVRLCRLDGSALGNDQLLRLHQFSRLLVKTGLPVNVLDRLLGAVRSQVTPENGNKLQELSNVLRISQLMNVSIFDATAIGGYTPLKFLETLFTRQNTAAIDRELIQTKIDASLNLEKKAFDALVTRKAQAIASLVNATPTDLVTFDVASAATKEVLSLYRSVRLSRHLEVRVDEYIELWKSFNEGLLGRSTSEGINATTAVQFLLWGLSRVGLLNTLCATLSKLKEDKPSNSTDLLKEKLKVVKAKFPTDSEPKGEAIGRAERDVIAKYYGMSEECVAITLQAFPALAPINDESDALFLEQIAEVVNRFKLSSIDLKLLFREDQIEVAEPFRTADSVFMYTRVKALRRAHSSSSSNSPADEEAVSRTGNIIRAFVGYFESIESGTAEPDSQECVDEYLSAWRFERRPLPSSDSAQRIVENAVREICESVRTARGDKTFLPVGIWNRSISYKALYTVFTIDRVVESLLRIGTELSSITRVTKLDSPDRQQLFENVMTSTLAGLSGDDRRSAKELYVKSSRESINHALCLYIKHRQGYTTDSDIFESLLLDPGSTSELTTTRLSYAIRSVQRFVTNVRLGRYSVNIDHPSLTCLPGQITEEWDRSLGSLRINQANLEVLSAPYLFMRPELRDEKTHLFQEAEKTLRQSPNNSELSNKVISTYVDGLTEVNCLDVCNVYVEPRADAINLRRVTAIPNSTLHVVARSRNSQVSKFFYRSAKRFENYTHWSPWEPIDVSFQVASGESFHPANSSATTDLSPDGLHLCPTVIHGKIYIFHPEFIVKPAGGSTRIGENGLPLVQSPEYSWEIRLSWVTRSESGWTAKRTTACSHRTRAMPAELLSKQHEWYAYVEVSGNVVRLILTLERQPSAENDWWREACEFVFSEAQQSVSSRSTQEKPSPSSGKRTPPPIDKYRTPPPDSVPCPPVEQFGIELVSAPDVLSSSKALPVRTFSAMAPVKQFRFGGDLIDWSRNIFRMQQIAGVRCFNQFRLLNKMSISNPLIGDGTLLTFEGKSTVTTTTSWDTPFQDLLIADDIATDYLSYGGISKQRKSTGIGLREVTALKSILLDGGTEQLLSLSTQRIRRPDEFLFHNRFRGSSDCQIQSEDANLINFQDGSPNSSYFSELFLHLPLRIQAQLSEAGLHADAISIGEKVYSPLEHEGAPSGWQYRPFVDPKVGIAETDSSDDVDLLDLLSGGHPSEAALRLLESVRMSPFRPFSIAKLSQDAMQLYAFLQVYNTRFRYADSEFRLFTAESVDRALAQYLILESMLGPRPLLAPPPQVTPRSYLELQPLLDDFGNVALTLENSLVSSSLDSAGAVAGNHHSSARLVLSRYFHVPIHPMILKMWSQLEDRLFKIRNGMTIEGERRALLPYGTKIDPMLLVESTAQGAGSGISDVKAPSTRFRFAYLLRVVRERIASLARINERLQSTLEKHDAEKLFSMQVEHEQNLSQISSSIAALRVSEANNALSTIQQQKRVVSVRWEHYAKLLGMSVDEKSGQRPTDAEASGFPRDDQVKAYKLVELSELRSVSEQYETSIDSDAAGVIGKIVGGNLGAGMGFAFGGPVGALVGAVVGTERGEELGDAIAGVSADVYSSPVRTVPGVGRLLAEEAVELEHSFNAGVSQANSADARREGSTLSISAGGGVSTNVQPLGLGLSFTALSPAEIKAAVAEDQQSKASMASLRSLISGKQAQIVLREQEFALQVKLAAEEWRHCRRMEAEALVRIKSVIEEMNSAEAVLDFKRKQREFLASKFSTADLYDLLKSDLASYQRMAIQSINALVGMLQRNLVFELGTNPSLGSVPPNSYQHSPQDRDLLSADAISRVVDSLESIYIENRGRKLQYLRHISLLQWQPKALLQLRTAGACEFLLSKSLFQVLDPRTAGRRIVSVAVSIPAISSSYGTVNAIVSHLGAGEAIESDTIRRCILSTGRDDSGVLLSSETNELYGVFEGAEIDDSKWKIELPSAGRLFSYLTISDVVLSITVECQYSDVLELDLGERGSGGVSEEALFQPLTLSYSISERHPVEWLRLRNGDAVEIRIRPDSSMLPRLLAEHAEFGEPLTFECLLVTERALTKLNIAPAAGAQGQASGELVLDLSGFVDEIRQAHDVVLLILYRIKS